MEGESNLTKFSRLKELDRERTQVLLMLSTIRVNLDNPFTTTSISDIPRLREWNNRLIDERLKLTGSTLGDPSRFLPVEIFIHIIGLTLRDTFTEDWYTETLLSFTLVSTRWRDILMSTPSLWRHICFKDSDTTYSEEILPITLHLSRNAPLVLWFRPPLHNWNEIRDKLYLHYHRVTEFIIDLRYNDSAASAPYGGILNILDEIRLLPSLKRLRFTRWTPGNIETSEISHFIECHPQLMELAGIRLPEDLSKVDYMQKITSFRSSHDPLSIVPYLNRMIQLSNVTFDDYSLSRTEVAHDEEEAAMGQYPNLLFQWTYYSQCGPPAIPLLSRTTTTLLHLNLQTNLSGTTRLLQILHEFRKLQTLNLELNAGPNDVIVVPSSPLQRCSSLQSVFISIFTLYLNTPQGDSVAWGPMFACMVRRFLSHIKSFTISAYSRSFGLPWEIVESAQFDSLEKLHLSLSQETNTPPDGFQLPTRLRSLAISGMRSGPLNLRSTSVTSLILHSSNVSTTLNHDLWPSITEMSVPASAVKWSGECFKYLQKITLWTERDDDWDYGTQFCRELAICPDHMPNLQEIHLADPPEWDILCILLERYNFRTEVGSTRISCVHLGGDVPFFLLDTIRDLCAGKFVDRPSNFELSWIGNMDIILDRNLPGCMKCLKTLLPCRIPWTDGSATHHSWKKRRNSDTISDFCLDILMDMPLEDGVDDPSEFRIRKSFVPVYPETDDEVLATWDARERAWQTMLQEAWHALRPSGTCTSYVRRHVRINEENVTVCGPRKLGWFLSSDGA
ncbi:hypothetical protein FRC15_001753 [Serendipita sp. 397]|nr:hypothetical protein FRC15_001753 [Serendipita sp. 397]